MKWPKTQKGKTSVKTAVGTLFPEFEKPLDIGVKTMDQRVKQYSKRFTDIFSK